jgi:hypothetical protein
LWIENLGNWQGCVNNEAVCCGCPIIDSSIIIINSDSPKPMCISKKS